MRLAGRRRIDWRGMGGEETSLIGTYGGGGSRPWIVDSLIAESTVCRTI